MNYPYQQGLAGFWGELWKKDILLLTVTIFIKMGIILSIRLSIDTYNIFHLGFHCFQVRHNQDYFSFFLGHSCLREIPPVCLPWTAVSSLMNLMCLIDELLGILNVYN